MPEELARCSRYTHDHPPVCELVKPGSRYRDGFQVELLRLAGLASPWKPFPPYREPGPPPRPADRVVIRAVAPAQTGYGLVVEQLGRGLEQLGVPIAFELWAAAEGYPPPTEFIRAREVQGRAPDAWTLQVGTPGSAFDPSRATIAFTMWETSRLAREAVASLNQCQLVVVPCEWNREAFTASGVRRPIAVVPLGVDCDRPRRGPRHAGQPFRFGMSGRIRNGENRKGLNEGMAAFVRAFSPEAHVELVVKVDEQSLATLEVPDDPRISVVSRPFSDDQMRAWYAGLDVFLFPSKAEGWGLQPLEAAAAGVPVIAARYGGVAEYFDGRVGWELEWDLGEASATHYAGIGRWVVPREESIVAALRAAAADPAEARRRGEAAAARAAEFTWDRTARELIAVLIGAGMLADPDAPPAPAPPAGTFQAANGATSSNSAGSHWDRLQLVNGCDYRGPRPVRESPVGEAIVVDPTRDPAADAQAQDYRLDYQHDEGIASCGCADGRNCMRGHGLVTLSQCLACVSGR